MLTMAFPDPSLAASNESITLQLFKADGITPDVFTPEPSSFALALGGLMAGAIEYRRRKSRAAL